MLRSILSAVALAGLIAVAHATEPLPHAGISANQSNELLELSHEQRLDIRTAGSAGRRSFSTGNRGSGPADRRLSGAKRRAREA
jgi:hypothetical protein